VSSGFAVLTGGIHMAIQRNYVAVSNKAWRQMEEFWLYRRPVLEHDEMARRHTLKAFAT
jgi:phage terminase large subunit GpA-like protein